MATISPAAYNGSQAGGKRGGVSVKKLKTVLKKAHLKMRGGADDVAPEVKEQVAGAVEEIKEEADAPMTAGRRHSRRHRKGKKGTRRH